MFRNEDDEMQALGLSPQSLSTPTTVGGTAPVVRPTEMRPQPSDMMLAQAESPDLSGMSFSPEELGLDEPVDIRGMSFTPAELGLPEDGLTEPRSVIEDPDQPPQRRSFVRDISRGQFYPHPPETEEDPDLPDFMRGESPDLSGMSFSPEELGLDEPQDLGEIDIKPDEFFQFTTDIYKGRTPEESKKIYQQFVDNENTVSVLDIGLWQENPETGERTFLFQPLAHDPFPVANLNVRIAASFINALGNVVELSGAVLDAIPGIEGNAQAARFSVPAINTGESMADALVYEGIPMFASAYLSAARVATVLKDTATKPTRALAAWFAGDAAATAVAPTDAGTIILGDDAMFPLLRGLDLTSSDSEEVLRKRIELLFDGALGGKILGLPLQGIANVGFFSWNFIGKPIWTAVRPSSAGLEEQISKQVVDQIAEPIVNAMSSINKSNLNNPEALRQVRLTIANAAEENQSAIVSGIRDVNQQIDLAFDTVTALTRRMPTAREGEVRMQLEQLRSGMIQGSQPRTITAVNRPTRLLQEELGGRLEDVGGATPAARVGAMQESAEGFADLGRADIRQDLRTVQELQQAFDVSAQDLIRDLAQSGDLANEVTRLSRAIGTEVPVTRDDSLEQILGVVENAYASMRTTKNELYGRIEGGPVDIGAIYDVLSNPAVDLLSNQGQVLLSSQPARRLAQLLQPRMVDAPSPVGGQQLASEGASAPLGQRLETREEVIARVQSVFDQEPDIYNFGLFHNVLRPELSSAASALKQTSPGASRAIRDIVRVIDDDLVEYVARQGDPDLARAAREAKKYYVQEFAPTWRSGKLGDFANLYDSTIGRTGPEGSLFRADDFLPESRLLVRQTIQEGDRDRIGQLKRLMERPEGGATSEPLSTFIVADTLLGAANELRRTGGTAADLNTFVGGLERYSSALRANFRQTADELDQFARDIESLQGDRVALARRLEEAEQALDTTARTIATGELQFFFRENYRGSSDALLREAATISDPIPAFRRLLTAEPASTQARLTDVMNRIDSASAEQRDVLFKGLETAYLTQLDSRLLGGTLESGGLRNLLSRNINNNLEEIETLYSAGDVIYRELPEVMESVRVLSDIAAGTNLSRNARPIAALSATEFNRLATTATNQFIYAAVGPLTRTGTRIRAFTGAVIQRNSPDERAAQILDRIFADPEYFAQLVRRYNVEPSDPLLQEMMVQYLIPTVFRARDADSSDIVGSAAQTELMLRDGADTVKQSVEDQTQRIFGPP